MFTANQVLYASYAFINHIYRKIFALTYFRPFILLVSEWIYEWGNSKQVLHNSKTVTVLIKGAIYFWVRRTVCKCKWEKITLGENNSVYSTCSLLRKFSFIQLNVEKNDDKYYLWCLWINQMRIIHGLKYFTGQIKSNH